VLVVLGATALLTNQGDIPDAPAATPPVTSAVAQVEETGEIDWIRVVPESANTEFRAATVGNGRIVAVGGGRGEDGASESNGQPIGASVWISDDAVSWSRVEDDSFSAHAYAASIYDGMYAVAFGNDRFVAGGLLDADAAIWTSPNAEDWTRVESPSLGGSGLQEIKSITAGGPGWVAVRRSELEGRIWVSNDGNTWLAIENPSFARVWFESVDQQHDQLVATGRAIPISDQQALSLTWVSIDGIDWEPLPQTTDVGSETHSIAVNPTNGSQLALNDFGVWSSNDNGATWVELVTSNGIPPFAHPIHSVVWLGDTIVAVHPEVGTFTSTDGGATWSRDRDHGVDIGWVYSLVTLDTKLITLGSEIWIAQPADP
jgi:hypothetical protein